LYKYYYQDNYISKNQEIVKSIDARCRVFGKIYILTGDTNSQPSQNLAPIETT